MTQTSTMMRRDDARPSTSHEPPRDQRDQRKGNATSSSKQSNIRSSGLKSSNNKDRAAEEDNRKRRKIDPSNADGVRESSETAANKNRAKETSGKQPSSSESSCSSNEDESRESYADKAAKNEWKVASYNKGNEKGKKSVYPAIRCTTTARNKELYVRGMSCADFRVYGDLEEAVRLFCKERGVNTVYQRVITYNRDSDNVGIKVVVRETDVAKISSKGFWPEGIWIREWSDEKPKNRERYFDNDKNSSDESL